MIIFYCIVIIFALMGIFLFDSSFLVCIMIIVSSILAIFLKLLLKEKLKYLQYILFPICIFLCFYISYFKINNYESKIKEVNSILQKGEYDKAILFLDELDKDYGSSDLSLSMRTQIYIILKDFNNSLYYLEKINNKKTVNYYQQAIKIYSLKTDDYSKEKINHLYLNAANDLPEDSHMQYMAGLVELNNSNYQSARYYLLKSCELGNENSLVYYYLGVISYEQRNYKESSNYFAESMERGLDDEKVAYIKWYLNEMLKKSGE